MQHTLSIASATTVSEPEASPAFNVVIAYEDFETGKQAKRTYDFLTEHLGEDCVFSNQMWKFDVLSLPKLREIAVNDALLADIIIISCRGDELPAHVKDWIESWVTESGNVLALVVLFDGSMPERVSTEEVRDYLANVARRGKMEFFVQPDASPRPRRTAALYSFERKPGAGERTLATLAGAVDQDYRYVRWGINE